jgi:hypothetical protein
MGWALLVQMKGFGFLSCVMVFAWPFVERPSWLGAIEPLHLTFSFAAQHQAAFKWRQVHALKFP